MKYVILFIALIFSNKFYSQEYEFINEVITPFEENNPIPVDTIYVNHDFLRLADYIQHINKETIELWWRQNRNSNIPPVELFLKNFNLDQLSNQIFVSQDNFRINKKQLREYFFLSTKEYIKNNPKKKYISISKPFFNSKMDWCVIFKSSYIPYLNSSGGGEMNIYLRIDGKWILYNKLTVWYN